MSRERGEISSGLWVWMLERHSSPSPSFSRFMKGLSVFSNKTAISVWLRLSARHVISSRAICTHKHINPSQRKTQTSFYFTLLYVTSFYWPEASLDPSSLLRRSRGRVRVLLVLEPIGLFCVKQQPSGSEFLCSPGCPQQLPALIDDA